MISPLDWTADGWTAAANWTMAIAAVAAAITAWRGLDAWKRETDWKEDRELARRFLMAVYSYKFALDHLRSMYHLSPELFEEGEKTLEIMSGDHNYIKRVVRLYESRWARVDKISVDLFTLLLETDSYWGAELREKWSKILKIEHRISRAIEFHLRWLNRENDAFPSHYENDDSRIRDFSIIFRDGNPGAKNETSEEIGLALLEIEHYLKEKIGSRKS